MKYLFLCNCYEDDLNHIPQDVEYLFVNCFITENENILGESNRWYIKPNFNINMKFFYIQKIRYKSSFYKAKKDMFSLPFNCVFKFGKCIYHIYNFVISENKIKKYVSKDVKKFLSNDLEYWFNLVDENKYNEYDFNITDKNEETIMPICNEKLYTKKRIFIYPVFNKTLNQIYKNDKIKNLYDVNEFEN